MTNLTLFTIVVMLACACTQSGYPRALAIAGATPVGAALVVGGIAVPTFYAASVGVALILASRLVRRSMRFERVAVPPIAGLSALVLFAAWGITITLLAPQLFSGARVFAPDGRVVQLEAGVFTSSNIAQVVYLLLSVMTVIFLARSSGAGPELIGLAAGLV